MTRSSCYSKQLRIALRPHIAFLDPLTVGEDAGTRLVLITTPRSCRTEDSRLRIAPGMGVQSGSIATDYCSKSTGKY